MTEVRSGNARAVRSTFALWSATGSGLVDLLAEDVRWTIAGSGPSARTFEGRQAFVDGALGPITTTFSGPMVPTIRRLVSDGELVVVHWDGVAPMRDGQTYRNSYAWFLTMRGRKVVKATAFLDLPTYDAALAGAELPPWRGPGSTGD